MSMVLKLSTSVEYIVTSNYSKNSGCSSFKTTSFECRRCEDKIPKMLKVFFVEIERINPQTVRSSFCGS